VDPGPAGLDDPAYARVLVRTQVVEDHDRRGSSDAPPARGGCTPSTVPRRSRPAPRPPARAAAATESATAIRRPSDSASACPRRDTPAPTAGASAPRSRTVPPVHRTHLRPPRTRAPRGGGGCR
jgi:hypothetical protein